MALPGPEPTRTPVNRSEGRLACNGIEISYETFGEPDDPPLVLVMGLAAQMIAWPDELCAALAGRGAFVVRFDNRDVGQSTHLTGRRPPGPAGALLRRHLPYTVADMASDTLGLLDALGLASAHLVGISMGGFVAQTLALGHPERVRTLTLMMTSTGSWRVGRARPGIYLHLLRQRHRRSRAEVVSAVVDMFGLIGSPAHPMPVERVQELAGRSWDRDHDPAGYLRQLAAAIAQENRTRALRHLNVPTLVIHGLHDPMIPPSGGLAIARQVPGARFVGFSGMGHDLPEELWPEIGELISGAVGRYEATAGAGTGAGAATGAERPY